MLVALASRLARIAKRMIGPCVPIVVVGLTLAFQMLLVVGIVIGMTGDRRWVVGDTR
jgi:hypothetical protein